MRNACRRKAFTLIEVLIVVVIMAVLAATIIPQFSTSTKDAQENTAKFNAHTMRSQLELYRAHHLGNFPTVANFAEQLTKSTNAAGAVGTAGTNFPYGPYMEEIPYNPFNNKNDVKAGTGGDILVLAIDQSKLAVRAGSVTATGASVGVGASFALYIGIAIWARAGSTQN